MKSQPTPGALVFDLIFNLSVDDGVITRVAYVRRAVPGTDLPRQYHWQLAIVDEMADAQP
jgi:hypothetical protein